PALVQRVALERLADELLEVVHRAPAARRADDPGPLVGGQFVAVLSVEPLPARTRRRLRVDDEPVEVEEERLDRHGDAEYVAWRSSASTSAARSPTRFSSTAASCARRRCRRPNGRRNRCWRPP